MSRDPKVPVAHGQGYTKLCKLGCGARIWLVPKADGSGWMALDLEPPPAGQHPAGNVAIDTFGRAYYAGPQDGETLWIAHQATCPPYLERQRQASRDAAQMRLGDDA